MNTLFLWFLSLVRIDQIFFFHVALIMYSKFFIRRPPQQFWFCQRQWNEVFKYSNPLVVVLKMLLRIAVKKINTAQPLLKQSFCCFWLKKKYSSYVRGDHVGLWRWNGIPSLKYFTKKYVWRTRWWIKILLNVYFKFIIVSNTSTSNMFFQTWFFLKATLVSNVKFGLCYRVEGNLKFSRFKICFWGGNCW